MKTTRTRHFKKNKKRAKFCPKSRFRPSLTLEMAYANSLISKRKPHVIETMRQTLRYWCLARESNSHGFLRTILSRLRLPFRQLGTGCIIYNHDALFKTKIIANTLHEKDL